jgi:hypothetical protein
MRRAAFHFSEASSALPQQQVRGKKKLAKISTIKVRLLEDVPRYGRQG